MFPSEVVEDKFMIYMMESENSSLWRRGTPTRHKSPEGGNDTIGFGHKLTDEEIRTNRVYAHRLDEPLSVKDCIKILRTDLVRAKITLTQRLETAAEVWLPDLPIRSQLMLLDFEFNLGNCVDKFPRFTHAVCTGDIAGQRKEFKRYYRDPYDGMKPLFKRNVDFWDTFLTDEVIEWWNKVDRESES